MRIVIITVASQKGGTGKTTTALAMWAGLSDSLAIDLDPQGNFTLAAGTKTVERNAHDVLTGACSTLAAIQHLDSGDIIPSTPELASLESKLTRSSLTHVLASVSEKYRYIILDTPPSLGMLTLNALCAADTLVIPMQADLFSFDGLNQLVDIVVAVRKKVNPALQIAGLLLTRFNPRSVVRREMRELAEKLAVKIETRVFNTAIREGVAIPEAQLQRKDIFRYAPRSNVAKDYRAFVNELKEVL